MEKSLFVLPADTTIQNAPAMVFPHIVCAFTFKLTADAVFQGDPVRPSHFIT